MELLYKPFGMKSKRMLQNLCWESYGMPWRIFSFSVCLYYHVELYVFLFHIHASMCLYCKSISINHPFSCSILKRFTLYVYVLLNEWIHLSAHSNFLEFDPIHNEKLSMLSSYLPCLIHILYNLTLKRRPSLLTVIPIQHTNIKQKKYLLSLHT